MKITLLTDKLFFLQKTGTIVGLFSWNESFVGAAVEWQMSDLHSSGQSVSGDAAVSCSDTVFTTCYIFVKVFWSVSCNSSQDKCRACPATSAKYTAANWSALHSFSLRFFTCTKGDVLFEDLFGWTVLEMSKTWKNNFEVVWWLLEILCDW